MYVSCVSFLTVSSAPFGFFARVNQESGSEGERNFDYKFGTALEKTRLNVQYNINSAKFLV